MTWGAQSLYVRCASAPTAPAFRPRVSISASADGKTWKPIRQLQPPRQGWQNNGHAYTYALKPFSARYVKLSWTPEGSEPGAEDLDAAKWKPTLKLREATFSSEPKIDNWEGKAGRGMAYSTRDIGH